MRDKRQSLTAWERQQQRAIRESHAWDEEADRPATRREQLADLVVALVAAVIVAAVLILK